MEILYTYSRGVAIVFYDLFGQKLYIGSYVMRRRKGEPEDPFQCHRASFGIIEKFVKEDGTSRPTVINVKPNDTWVEVCIRPFSRKMIPLCDSRIQWTPEECIKIGWFIFLILVMLWPITQFVYVKTLCGQSTDW